MERADGNQADAIDARNAGTTCNERSREKTEGRQWHSRYGEKQRDEHAPKRKPDTACEVSTTGGTLQVLEISERILTLVHLLHSRQPDACFHIWPNTCFDALQQYHSAPHLKYVPFACLSITKSFVGVLTACVLIPMACNPVVESRACACMWACVYVCLSVSVPAHLSHSVISNDFKLVDQTAHNSLNRAGRALSKHSEAAIASALGRGGHHRRYASAGVRL